MLNGLLKKEAIELCVDVDNWEEAVRHIGKVMEKAGITSPGYDEAMIQNIKTFGNYIVIAPGLALPHAFSPENVIRPGLALITLKKPVNFGHEDNDPVKVIIGVAGTDSTTHLNTMQTLANILYENDEKFVEDIWNCSEVEEVMDVISSANKQFS